MMDGQGRLRDKAIIVIGAGTGIGAATARRLASEGARVCMADINIEAAAKVAAELSFQGHEVFAVAVDLADPKIDAEMERILKLSRIGLGAR